MWYADSVSINTPIAVRDLSLNSFFLINGLELNLSHSAKHLGYLLSFNRSDTDDIIVASNGFWTDELMS